MADNTGLQFTLTLPGADDTAVVRFNQRAFTLPVDVDSRTYDVSPSGSLDQAAWRKIIEIR